MKNWGYNFPPDYKPSQHMLDEKDVLGMHTLGGLMAVLGVCWSLYDKRLSA